MKSRLVVVAACMLAVMPHFAVAQKIRATPVSAAAEQPVLPLLYLSNHTGISAGSGRSGWN